MNSWIAQYEAIWLFWILAAELVVGLFTLTILLIEFFYDKAVIENSSKKTKRTKKHKVVVKLENGQAYISEQPKDIDVVIEHGSEK
jgi:hypothetical protein